jgi:hypothetical protein
MPFPLARSVNPTTHNLSAYGRNLLSILLGLFVSLGSISCASRPGQPTITAAPGNAYIKERFDHHLKELEELTKKRYRGNSIHIAPPVNATYEDWRKMPVGQIRGRNQGGLTAWKLLSGHSTVYFAQWKGKVPDWLIRHEALHTILLSNGILGHPEDYAPFFGKSYWWLPEDYFIKKRNEIVEAAHAASCCPYCEPLDPPPNKERSN